MDLFKILLNLNNNKTSILRHTWKTWTGEGWTDGHKNAISRMKDSTNLFHKDPIWEAAYFYWFLFGKKTKIRKILHKKSVCLLISSTKQLFVPNRFHSHLFSSCVNPQLISYRNRIKWSSNVLHNLFIHKLHRIWTPILGITLLRKSALI